MIGEVMKNGERRMRNVNLKMDNEEQQISSLAQSMEQTMETGNLSVVGDIGEVMLDAVLDDGILRDVPILSAIVGTGKCVKNVSDILFAKKLITFLWGIKDADAKAREDAIIKWENDEKYRARVGETLLNMINRCDDTQKALWLSKLFYNLVLKHGYTDVFLRTEKTLSMLSVADVYSFLSLPANKYQTLTLEEAEWYSHTGLYMMEDHGKILGVEILQVPRPKMIITEVGICIYTILNDLKY